MNSFHHLTHIDNLDKILKSSLKSREKANEFKDTANLSIIGKRNSLNGYVPFHLDSLQKRHGISYNKAIKDNFGRDNLVFFILEIDSKLIKLLNKMKYYVYHPVCNWAIECNSYPEFLDKINEKYFKLPKNFYGPDYNITEVQEFFMSELLIKDEVPISCISKLVVLNEEAEKKVKKICLENNKDMLIEIDSSYAK